MSKMESTTPCITETVQHKHQQLHTYIRTHPQFPLAGYVATGRPVQRRILQPGPVPSYRTSGSGAGLTFRPPDFPFPRQHDGVCPRKTDATRLTQPVSLFSQCELATQWAPWPLTDRLPLTTTPPAVVKNENKGNVERAERYHGQKRPAAVCLSTCQPSSLSPYPPACAVSYTPTTAAAYTLSSCHTHPDISANQSTTHPR
ncbi:hypothetical protein JOL62DRAFT_575388 [Phyllosticta paracitricarpa]|uniref:Uncharacterized protein n=1 Tax=Phyllosticta paracitricarpa TaxID=2016321 RepID=A0ABR1N5Y0_9PEZI